MSDNTSTRLVSLCSGYGGLDLAVEAVTGAETVAYSEVDQAASTVFARHWPGAEPLGDLTTADWSAVDADIVCAGFPCQDLSYAGKGAGITKDSRSGLWYAIEHALGVLRPRLVVLENVSAIVARRPGLDVVLAGLASLGFDAQWTCVRASDVGAPHRRERWFLVAYAYGSGLEGRRRQGFGRADERAAWADGFADAADTVRAGTGRDARGLPREAGEGGRTRVDVRSARDGRPASADTDGDGPDGAREAAAWGDYRPAIERWECILGRPAPAPTDARGRLSPPFVEWMMGWPQGHVDGLPRSKALRVLGNGVVPQQAAAALRVLMRR